VLGITDQIAEIIEADAMVPAVGQGCVALECRADDHATLATLAMVDDAETRHAVVAERAFLAELGSGCSLPIGAHIVEGQLIAFLANDAGRVLQTTVRLGHDWNTTAVETARALLAEIER